MSKLSILLEILISFFLGTFFVLSSNAQEVEFTASANPDVLVAGDQFSVVFSSNERIDDLSLQELPDFQFLAGPMRGESKSVQMVNGKVTSVSTYQYVLYFMALKEGKFTIPPATAKIGSREYKSNAVIIQVVAGKNQAIPPAGGNDQNPQSGEIDESNLFVRLLVNKTDVYLGEPVEMTIKIYTRVDLSGVDPAFKGPDLQGFFTEVDNMSGNITREVYNGNVYNTAVLRKYYAFPQKTGEFTFEPFNVDVAVRQEVRRRISDPLFNDFLFPEIEEIPLTLTSRPVKINVKPLPPDAPVSFGGAVGSFDVTSSLSKTETLTNDPLTLKYSVSGTGNLKLINEINVHIPPDLEKYDPVIGTKMDSPLKGTKTFEYMIIPHMTGSFSIPAAEFTYFDPSSGEYKTIYSDLYNINVSRGPDETNSSPGILRNEVEVLNNDIHYIKIKNIKLFNNNNFFAGSFLYYVIVFLLLAVFILIIFIRHKLNIQNSDITGVRKRKADLYARKRLKHCQVFLDQGKFSELYDELLAALWRYLADKLDISMAKLSRDTAEEALSSKITDRELINEFFRITGECEIARYSRSAENSDIKKLYSDAIEVISRLQQKLR